MADDRFPTTIEELRAFVRAEVKKALADEKDTLFREFHQHLLHDIRMQSGMSPSWTRMETK